MSKDKQVRAVPVPPDSAKAVCGVCGSKKVVGWEQEPRPSGGSAITAVCEKHKQGATAEKVKKVKKVEKKSLPKPKMD